MTTVPSTVTTGPWAPSTTRGIRKRSRAARSRSSSSASSSRPTAGTISSAALAHSRPTRLPKLRALRWGGGSLPDAEPCEHLVEHALADLDAAQLSKCANGVAELDRNDLRRPACTARGEGRGERIAGCLGERYLARGRHECLLAAFL